MSYSGSVELSSTLSCHFWLQKNKVLAPGHKLKGDVTVTTIQNAQETFESLQIRDDGGENLDRKTQVPVSFEIGTL